MKAIVAVDKLWGIGSNGDLLFRIKEDMKFFKLTTINRVVVMGRKTFESLPNKEPLKDRINLVITSDKSYKSHDNVIFGTIDEIKREIKKYKSDDVFIIGGGSVYRQFIHECDTVYITHNSNVYEKADTYMSNLAFEGFKFNKIIYKDEIDPNNNYWSIAEWVACKSNPYKSVLWYNDNKNNTTFLYSDDLTHWRDIFSNHLFELNDEIKKCISKKMILKLKKLIVETSIGNYYKAEISYPSSKGYIRIASYGETKIDAWLNLMVSVVHL